MSEEDKKLGIDKLREEQFRWFRKKFLDGKVLSDEALVQMRVAFDLDRRTTETVSVDCNEAHSHNYSCLKFSNRSSAVVLRLLGEIEMYQIRLNKIRKDADYRK